MSEPTPQDYLRIAAIAAALCALALLAAFAGLGLTAFIVLALVVGPVSFYANQLLARRVRDQRSTGARDASTHSPR